MSLFQPYYSADMENIRFAKIEDSGAMLDIYAPYVLETAISFETEVPSLAEFQSRVVDTLPKYPWLIYEIDNRIVAYAYAGSYRSRCAYGWSLESTVYVDRNFRGNGIGTKLYRTLFQLLKEQGAVNVFAGITQPNEASVRLHESLGFVPVGIYKDIGFKIGKWWDVGWWQLQLQKPERPDCLRLPRKDLNLLDP